MSKYSFKESFLIFFVLFIFIINSRSFAQYIELFPELRTGNKIEELDSIQAIYNSGEKEQAIASLDSLSNIYLEKKQYEKYLFLKNEAGNLLKSIHKFKQGYHLIDEARQVFSENNDTINLEYSISIYFMESLGYYGKLPYPGRIEMYKWQLSILEKLENVDAAYAQCLANMGLFYNSQGEMDLAIQYLMKAKEIGKKINKMALITIADYTMITRLAEDENLLVLKNLELLYKSINQYRNQYSMAFYLMYISHQLGYNFYETGEYEKAFKYNSEAEQLLDSMKFPVTRPMVIFPLLLAESASKLGKYDIAKRKIAKADSAFHNQVRKRTSLGEFYLMAANTFRHFNPDSALKLADKGLEDTTSGNFYADNMQVKSKILSKQGKHQEALKCLHAAINSLHGIYATSQNITSVKEDAEMELQRLLYTKLAEEYYKIYQENQDAANLEKALIASYKADTCYSKIAVNRSAFNIAAPILKEYAAFTAHTLNIIHELEQKTGTLKTDDAAYFIFHSKGISIHREILKMQFEAGLSVNSKLVLKQNQLNHDIREVKNELNALPENADSIKRELTWKLKDLEIENLVLNYEIKKEIDKLPLESARLADKTIVQKLLHDKEAILEYVLKDTPLYSICITKDTAIFYTQFGKHFHKELAYYLYDLKTGKINPENDNFVSELLLSGFSPLLSSVEHLIIVPDKSLHLFPFENLKVPGKTTTKMVEKYSMLYQYSSPIWAHFRNTVKSEKENALAVAPVFEKSDYNLSELKENSFYRSMDSVDFQNIFRSPDQLASLPYSFEEISQIKEIAKPYMNTQILSYHEATEKNIKKNIEKYDIIHFATHGFSSKRNFEESGLFFQMNQQDYAVDPTNDGFLHLGEIYNMELKADLVVLSACKSGSGQFVQGEGVMALPKGFIYSGVPNIVCSLWKIHDQNTKKLMTTFYRYVFKGNSYADALRMAKLDMIKNGMLPLDWSGIILIGN